MSRINLVPFLVKVCGITSTQDARVALDFGANALGFNFYRKSPRFLTLENAAALAQSLSEDYLRVGVFVSPTPEELSAALRQVRLDVAQIHGALPHHLPEGIRFWRAIAPAKEPPDNEPPAEAYLLDTPSRQFGGSGIAFDWQQAAGFRGHAILAGGLDANNVEQAIAAAQPWGVDACSRLESSPGVKDPRRVEAFVSAALRGAQQLLSPEITL